VHEHVRCWGPEELWVGCSGNFTVERCVAELVGAMHGNDVSIYTCALGSYFAEQPFRVAVREELKERWGWLDEYLEDPAQMVATIMIGTRMLDHADSDQRYYLRLQEGYRQQWPAMMKKTVERIQANRLRLQSFYAGDVVEFLRLMPESASFVSFPPFFCMEQGERVLTEDLRWVPCGDLRVGDRLMAFEEYPQKGNRERRWQRSVVTRSEPAMAECVRVHLADGSSVVTTLDHPWLAEDRRPYSGGRFRRWTEAHELADGRAQQVVRILEPWRTAGGFEAGWLSGMLDGDGCISMRKHAEKGHNSLTLSMSQNPGLVADRTQTLMAELGVELGVSMRPSGVLGMGVKGGIPEVLRVLGVLRPLRLLENLSKLDIEQFSVRSWGDAGVKVMGVEPVGRREIQSLSTSSRTYIGEGFAMHNSGGYEVMWKWLDKVLEWDTPEYQLFDDDRRAEMFELVKSKERWLMATNVKQTELTEHQVGWIQVTDRNVPFWVYSSIGSSRVAVPRQKLEPVLMPRLGQGQEIGDEIALHTLTPGQFGSLRSQYLDPRIAPGQAMLTVGVSVDGHLVGCFAASQENFPGARWAHSGAYLMSDFAVAPTEYPRLSKLVVMAACSKEAQLLMQRTLNRRIRGLTTTAFSDNAVSMKYDRGTAFTLVSRKDSPSPRFRYQLQYEAPLGELSLAETLVEWKKRHGKRRTAERTTAPEESR